MHIHFLDPFREGDSPVHRLDPRVKFILAVAFIFTIHFFNTHFRPDKFPMDPVIFTGRMTLAELKHDKPEEYDRLMASGKLETHMVDPFPRSVERGLKAFGFVALFVGLSLIALILYAMLVGYQ